MPGKGLLISFEGTEGCGKSTQINLLHSRLLNAGHRCERFREPGGTEIGEEIRHLLQHAPSGIGMTNEAELLLFAASRAQLVRECIVPLLLQDTIVLLDRFLDSTTVYQGLARGLPLESVTAINAFAVGPALPKLTFLLDLPCEVGRERILKSRAELDRIESQPLAFFEKVRQGYLQIAAQAPERIQVLDATQSAEVLHLQIWRQMESALAES